MGRGHQPGSPVNATRRWMLVPSLLAALVLHACGGGSATSERESETGTAACRPTGTKLRIKAGEPTHKFSKDCLAAPANKPFTISFMNLDESSHGQHNIEIEDAFEGETIDGFGESITYKIGPLEAGTYTFFCTKHPFMNGTLVAE
jgi:plastocyanin